MPIGAGARKLSRRRALRPEFFLETLSRFLAWPHGLDADDALDFDRPERAAMRRALRQGLLRRLNGRLVITEAGREVLDAGGVLPVRLKEFLFACLDSLPVDEAEEARFVFNMYLDQNAASLREALEMNVPLYRDQCEDDPEEICLRASGRAPDGMSVEGMTVALFAPWWDKELAPHSKLLADLIVEHRETLTQLVASAAGMRN